MFSPTNAKGAKHLWGGIRQSDGTASWLNEIFGENEFAYFLFFFLEPRILLQLHQNRPRVSNCDRSSSIHQGAKRAAGLKEDHFSLYT